MWEMEASVMTGSLFLQILKAIFPFFEGHPSILDQKRYIKDGRVAFKICKNRLPVIKPKSQKKAEGQPKEEAKNQVSMNISMGEWQLMDLNLNITEASIPTSKQNR